MAVFVVRADSGDASATRAVVSWARQHLPAITHHAHAAGLTGQTLLKVSMNSAPAIDADMLMLSTCTDLASVRWQH